MALIRNIAGFTVGATAAVPSTSQTADGGLLQNLVRTSADLSAAVPVVQAVAMGINLLPAGGLKTWLTKNPAQFWQSIIQIFTGRTYTGNEYQLGERYIDQVLPDTPVNSVTSYRQVPDEVVPQAQLMFTVLFVVRITTQDDLDALQRGVSYYQLRPDKADIPLAAIERAVNLKQKYFPDSLYNVAKWNLDYFSKFPLVAPIPDPWHVGQLYSGPLPGGALATNGLIIGENLGTAAGSSQAAAGTNWLLWAGLALAAYAGYRYSKNPKQKLKWTI